MSSNRCLWVGLASLAWALAGCETPEVQALLPEAFRNRINEGEIEQRRADFIERRDPESFRWLLTHAVENGMTVMDVNRIMGDSGERIDGDEELKRQRGEILQTDVAYKWGPDRDGQSVILFFREERLVHFRAEKLAALADHERL